MDRKTANELQNHMLGTYFGLRVGLVVIGIALPLVVLFTGGVLHHIRPESSISAYYHSQGLSYLTTRDFFVGSLFAVGACLYLYKGFSTKENVALNLAGVFAILVALLPTAAPSADRTLISTLHGTTAVLFFLCIAYVSLFRSRDTIHLLAPEKRARYARMYFLAGLAMIASPLAAVALSFVLEPTSRFRTLTFWAEAFGVWTFAAYWIIKTREMRHTKAEKRALDAQLKREVVLDTSLEPEAVPLGEGRTAAPRDLSRQSSQTEMIVPAAPDSYQPG